VAGYCGMSSTLHCKWAVVTLDLTWQDNDAKAACFMHDKECCKVTT